MSEIYCPFSLYRVGAPTIMPLNRDQLTRLSLGGTTALPVTIGRIELETEPTDPNASPTGEELVMITEEKKPGDANVWLVHLKDIAALEIPQKDSKGNPSEPERKIGIAEVFAKLKEPPKYVTGTAYVNEVAGVLLRLEYGTTAGDSVQIAEMSGTDGFGVTCHPRNPPCS